MKMAEEKAKKERRDERKERREEMRRTLGIADAAEGDGEEEEDAVAGVVDTEVVEYGSGVTVTVEGID